VVTVWLACPWRPGRELTAASARDLIGFGGSVTAAAVVNFLNRRSDDFLVGLVLGSTALGFYTLAYKLLLLMTDVLTRTIEVVAFPVLARVGGDQRRLASGFYTANRVSSAVAAPAFLFVAAFAPEVVEVAFGSEWAASASVLRALALMGLLQASLLSHSTLVAAAGRPALSLLVTAVNGVANLAAFALVVRHGIVAVAVAYAVVGYLLAPLSLWTVRRVLAFDVRRYLAIVAGPALAAAVAVGLVLLLDEALESLPTAARLGAAALATLPLYAVALRLTVPAGAAELLDLAKGALPGSRPA
ncbi:MAG: oligosaccharide flippase family protein, partial [Acidimicrobiia bacterium]|nr:oligosaccharide flippase family protein [Acidimicrobiia bacterium]